MAWSSTGGIGAAVAEGRPLGLDMAAIRNAIAIALSQAPGFQAMHGSLSTPLMPVQTGPRAALSGQGEFTGSPAALEGR